MRKVPLGTHYTSLGYHPENKIDLTPIWFIVVYFISFGTVFFLLLTDTVIVGERLSLSLAFLLFVCLKPIAVAIFNRKQKTNNNDALFAILFLGFGIFYLFRS